MYNYRRNTHDNEEHKKRSSWCQALSLQDGANN